MNGSLAGSISGLLTTPMDVLKTRRMTFQNQGSIPELVRQIVAEDGVQGLFRGASVRIFYLSIGGCAFFGIYEKAKQLVERQVN
jgi:solute carrier family 25 S-adenosylmethionine transporter 26